jgi:CelD/BcsL family acetyltransferase involved in cellulose biosynthesis
VDDALAADWDEIADRAGAIPFARPGWLRPWAERVGVCLEALTASCGERLTGVLPLIWEPGRVRTPADWHTPWVEAVAEDAVSRTALTAALAATGRPRVTIDFVLEGSPTAAGAARSLAAAGYRLESRPRLQSPYLALEQTWEQYQASLSAHRRSELRRRTRRLESAGTVACEVHGGTEGLDVRLHEAFTVEAAGWKGAAGTAILSEPGLVRFYRRVAHWAAGRGGLRLAFLRVDGRPVAFDLAIEEGGRHYLLKTGFDPAFAALSPGLLLRARMVQRAFEAGLATYEFCGEAEPWKLEWAAQTRRVLVIEAYAPGVAGSLARVGARTARFARRQARRRQPRR